MMKTMAKPRKASTMWRRGMDDSDIDLILTQMQLKLH